VCSILGIFNLLPGEDLRRLRREAVFRSNMQRHRGPDASGIHIDEGAVLAHERLAIVDPGSGSQPLLSSDRQLVLAVNGEIYNHVDLKRRARRSYEYQTHSDGEVINALYREERPESFLNDISGIFAFALWDRIERRVLIARDPIGVCPLYWGHDREGRLWVASEMKALGDICADVSQFPPGCYYDSEIGAIRKYYSRPWREYSLTRGVSTSPGDLRHALEDAVRRQLMADVPYGVLLSGGLDSSLVAACAAKASRQSTGSRIHSFTIGLNGAPDLASAQVAATALGTIHHGFVYTLEEGLDALPDVIRHVESYDVTTIRSAIPTYLLARRIKSMGIKMVLSGEGADEVFGGYLYFHKAPSAQAFHEETIRKLDALHLYDCLRGNKAMMAWGVEMRVPYLDVELAMRMDATGKMAGSNRMEKSVLREAFEGCLPDAILWRQKEQFSDGVGYEWLDAIKACAAESVSDRELAAAAHRFPVNTPQTREAYMYRRIFERHFPHPSCALTVPWGKSIACSSPAALEWDASFAAAADPSGRAMSAILRKT
jgi:asparagine synthase (glutamine-hydrolysing)